MATLNYITNKVTAIQANVKISKTYIYISNDPVYMVYIYAGIIDETHAHL